MLWLVCYVVVYSAGAIFIPINETSSPVWPAVEVAINQRLATRAIQNKRLRYKGLDSLTRVH